MKVMLCIKDSPGAESIVGYYAKVLYRTGDEVYLLHVSDPLKLPVYVHAGGVGYIPQKAEEAIAKLRHKNESIRKKYQGICNSLEIEHEVVIESNKDGIGETIVKVANRSNVDLIVMGSRGLGLIGRIILGSIDDYVKQNCKIPTLVCPDSF